MYIEDILRGLAQNTNGVFSTQYFTERPARRVAFFRYQKQNPEFFTTVFDFKTRGRVLALTDAGFINLGGLRKQAVVFNGVACLKEVLLSAFYFCCGDDFTRDDCCLFFNNKKFYLMHSPTRKIEAGYTGVVTYPHLEPIARQLANKVVIPSILKTHSSECLVNLLLAEGSAPLVPFVSLMDVGLLGSAFKTNYMVNKKTRA